ncbi:MAG: pyrroline-5-carboxylate reductase [Solirubrobacterales bacterium]
MTQPEVRLSVIGCGRMAQALLAGLSVGTPLFDAIVAYDLNKSVLDQAAAKYGAEPVASAQEAARRADYILLAVKPAQIIPLLFELKPALKAGHTLISVAAGITVESMAEAAGPGIGIVRVMPNTPSLIGEGMTAVCFDDGVTESARGIALRLFASVGEAIVVPESYMDAVTAIAGSGPAYFYLMADAMMDAAVDIGLPRDMARILVQQTMSGTGQMLKKTGEHPAALRDQVTSPGGTSIAGIRSLELNGFRGAIHQAIRTAFERAGQLRK